MTLRLNGSTSGYTEIDAPAVAGSNTIVLPSGNGSANQLLKNGSTAGSLEFSSSVYIDSSQRLLVGTSTSSRQTRMVLQGNSTNAADEASIYLTCGNTSPANGNTLGFVGFGDSGNTLASLVLSARDGGTWTSGSSHPSRLVFSTTADGASSPTARMYIKETGRVGINASAPAAYLEIYPEYAAGNTSKYVALILRNPGQGNVAQFFADGGNQVGNINVTASATAYNTSSDYRLKENIVPLTGAVDRLNQLQVHRFNFIADPSKTVDGFIAHEAQDVVPECVTGTKDEVDADGNPVYQGIDQSKLVPLLTAALQEALQKIKDLEGRLTAAGI